jgi:hypothetical protein
MSLNLTKEVTMRVITLDTAKKVISVKTVGDAYVLQLNDIMTDLGDMGMIQQLDGSFIIDTTPIPPQPPNKIDLLQDNFDIMYAQILMLQGVTVSV